MQRLTAKKLLHSKWTALAPTNKEKHFLVTDVEFDEDGTVLRCVIEAVMTKREREIDWQELKNQQAWKMGWQ